MVLLSFPRRRRGKPNGKMRFFLKNHLTNESEYGIIKIAETSKKLHEQKNAPERLSSILGGLFYVRTRARDGLCLLVVAAVKPLAENFYEDSRFNGYYKIEQ